MNSRFETAPTASRFQPIQNWILACGLFAGCVCSAGCDLGTYNQRLNDRTTPPVEAEAVPESDSPTEEAAEN